jgi:hypothetical protein
MKGRIFGVGIPFTAGGGVLASLCLLIVAAGREFHYRGLLGKADVGRGPVLLQRFLSCLSKGPVESTRPEIVSVRLLVLDKARLRYCHLAYV